MFKEIKLVHVILTIFRLDVKMKSLDNVITLDHVITLDKVITLAMVFCGKICSLH